MKNQEFSGPGGSRGALEAALGRLWNALGALLGALEAPYNLLMPLEMLLGASWGRLEATWEL